MRSRSIYHERKRLEGVKTVPNFFAKDFSSDMIRMKFFQGPVSKNLLNEHEN